MAITVSATTNLTEYVYNPFWWKIDSPSWGQRGFKYVIDVYATASWNPYGLSTYTRYKLPPSPDNSAYFSPARVLESYVRPEFYPSTTAFHSNTDPYAIYAVVISEEYDISPGPLYTGTTIYPSTYNSGPLLVINAVKQIEDPWNLDSRLYSSGNTSPYYLTDWNVSYPKVVRADDYETFSWYSIDRVGEYTISTFDSGATQIGEFRITSGYNSLLFHHTIGVGPKNLNYSSYNYVTSGSTPILGSDVVTYQVYNSDSGVPRSAIYTFSYDQNECLLFEPTRIAWLNRWGAFDYFGFSMVKRDFIERKNNEWNKFAGYGFSKGDRGRKNLNTEAKKKFTVTSDFIQTYEAEFLETLFTSGEIYQVFTDGTYVPIQLTDKEFEIKGDNDSLITYTLTFENIYDIQLQRS